MHEAQPLPMATKGPAFSLEPWAGMWSPYLSSLESILDVFTSLFTDATETLGISYLIFLIQGWRLFSNILLHFTHPSMWVCSASLTKRMQKQKSHLSIIPTSIYIMKSFCLPPWKGRRREEQSDGTSEWKKQHHKSENKPFLFGIIRERKVFINTQRYFHPLFSLIY